MSVPFIPTRNSTAGSTAAPTTSQLTTLGQCAINTYTGSFYMRKEDATISDIVGDRLSGFRNRLINGNMAIDQRNAGVSVTPADGAYTVDRWAAGLTQASKFSIQQNAGAISGPIGLPNYLGATSLSAYTVLAGDTFRITQAIEGVNFADFGWGSASASPVTLSFWVRSSSLTGTFGGSLRNSASNRSYPFTYTITAASTWEQKTVVIAGDTSGTWVGATNGIGVSLAFSLGSGATFSGTAGAWAAANYISATGAVSLVGTNAATLYITGVQLEKGLVPTPFEVRSYSTELALCQRYCLAFPVNSFYFGGTLRTPSTTQACYGVVPIPVSMRAAPTAPVGSHTFYCGDNSASANISISGITPNSIYVSATISSAIGTIGAAFVALVTTGNTGIYSAEL